MLNGDPMIRLLGLSVVGDSAALCTLDMAAQAVEGTLADVAIDAAAVQLAVLACDDFEGDRPPGADPAQRTALLDNAFNETAVRTVLYDRGLRAAAPFGVAGGGGSLGHAAVEIAVEFLQAEPEVFDVVVVVVCTQPGQRRAGSCVLTRRAVEGPVVEGLEQLATRLCGEPPQAESEAGR